MKRIILGVVGAMVFYGLAFAFMNYSKVRAQNEPPVTPVTPVSDEGHSTGGVWAKSDDLTLKLNFNAHQNPVKGKVLYSDNDGNKFWGDVDQCYFQSENQAVFGGTITKGNVSENYFTVQVQDNGEGFKASGPDMLTVDMGDSLPNCTPGNLEAEVTKGNIQVHQ